MTNPERIPRRFLPMSGNLKIGGGDQLEGNAGGTTVAFYTTIPEAAPET